MGHVADRSCVVQANDEADGVDSTLAYRLTMKMLRRRACPFSGCDYELETTSTFGRWGRLCLISSPRILHLSFVSTFSAPPSKTQFDPTVRIFDGRSVIPSSLSSLAWRTLLILPCDPPTTARTLLNFQFTAPPIELYESLCTNLRRQSLSPFISRQTTIPKPFFQLQIRTACN